MISEILRKSIREKAGSDSYNRFEYQVHWIVYHMISEFKKNRNNDYLILCEFHDDMAKLDSVNNPNNIEFFQVKTTITRKTWSVSSLCETTPKKVGVKNSFLGFIFINFLNFKDTCKACHFVSNLRNDEELREWQSVIEDGKILENENTDLYNKLYETIKSETIHMKILDFDLLFNKFIQNTFIYGGELHLDHYEKIVKGEFFDMLSDEEITFPSSHKILQDLLNDVRKKSKKIIEIPISFDRLKEQKGINSAVIQRINDAINVKDRGVILEEIENYLNDEGYPILSRKAIKNGVKEHHTRLLSITDTLYFDSVQKVELLIKKMITNNPKCLNDVPKMITQLKEEMKKYPVLMQFEIFNLEVLLYANLFK